MSEGSGRNFKSPLTFGRLYEQQGELAKARKLYLAAAKQPKTQATALHRLAVLAGRAGEPQQAELYFARARRLSPRDPGLLNDLGYHYLQQGKHLEAEQALREALRLDPTHARAWSNLGLALGQQGRMQQSVEAFRQVLSDAEAYTNVAYLHTQRGEYAAAARWYEQALALDPTLGPAADGLAELQAYRGPVEQQPVIETVSASSSDTELLVAASAYPVDVPRRAAEPARLPVAAEPTEDVGIATIGFDEGAPTAQPEDAQVVHREDSQTPHRERRKAEQWPGRQRSAADADAQSRVEYGGWRARRQNDAAGPMSAIR